MTAITPITVRFRDGFEVTYFEQECPVGCGLKIGGSSEEQVRAFVKGHRGSACIERKHRERVFSDRQVRQVRKVGLAAAKAAEVAAPPPPPLRKPRAKKQTGPAIGWDGKVIG